MVNAYNVTEVEKVTNDELDIQATNYIKMGQANNSNRQGLFKDYDIYYQEYMGKVPKYTMIGIMVH